MDPINFGYSLKNIGIPSQRAYKYKLMEKVVSVIMRFRWKMFHFKRGQNVDDDDANQGLFLKSRKCPPSDPDLADFENDLLKMVENIKFVRCDDPFQKKIREDINFIKNSNKIFVQADKTSNFYEMTKEHYEKTLLDKVTKGYKQCKDNALRKVNLEAKEFAEHFLCR